MASHFVIEHELVALLEELDAAADIIGGACECNPDDLSRDDLVLAISIINKAANFVQRSLEQHTESGGKK
jgi:hypothetical protein